MNSEQQKAYDFVTNGKNLLLEGVPGGGKSYTLNHIVKWARSNGMYVGVTATTGSAGILIGGTTLHSYLGIGIGNKGAKELAELIRIKKKFVYNRLINLEMLVIDEISMMDSVLIDMISELLCIIRKSNKPFGGVQMVLCGDLFQLPPINNRHFFKSKVWEKIDIETVELKESQRHKEDIEFIKILEELKFGKCSRETLETLKLTKNNTFPEGILPTILYTKNVDVDEMNNEKLNGLLASGARSFDYKFSCSCEGAKAWAQSCKIPDSVKLCVGAQVVLTWNVDLANGLCNGARGVVEEVGTSGVYVRFTSGKVILIGSNTIENEDHHKIWMCFMPLRLAYAITINKAQGMTLDCAIVVFDKYCGGGQFMYGRAYTALSRVRNLKSVQLINVSASCFVTHPDVIEYYENIMKI
jgi:ATP-dependent exoDNAse (exonuclease V) alpha subunit